MPDTRIVRAGADRIDDLRPLWQSLHDHHAEIAPALGAIGQVRSREDSWAVRRACYEEWLAEPDAFVLIAEVDSEPDGYALVHIRGPEETWTTGDRVAKLETLTVLPTHRGRGLGSALIEAVHRELNALGVTHIEVSVVASNTEAIRFYDRLNMQPFLQTYLGRVPEPG
jgi:ribosomal protein S18 acetylase RimI-like enzyme